jgi:ubiquinone/menaquinone biosynthesis C-methylase UbiE
MQYVPVPKCQSDIEYRALICWYRIQDLLKIGAPVKHIAKAPLAPGMTIVDYACGPGRYSVPIAKAVGADGHVYAVDIHPLAIKTMRQRVARAGLGNVTPILARGYTTGIPATVADGVVLVDVFHSIDDPNSLLQEIHRILKPGGWLFMDPGHMPREKARSLVQSTGMLVWGRTEGNDMIWYREQ